MTLVLFPALVEWSVGAVFTTVTTAAVGATVFEDLSRREGG
eukprot:CAMPEP_0170127306 /NCGR_PEP_ID=MMETSP0020_2-20130122/20345_1 /TAXON_ID=98059 /ORGANISM="Dinobryon sp., Strain UTEXLB2267" /LENGTH=40 /DNA_ID= /DNA_START= /DNA_END= /DNA_ORIENTATION=